MKVSGSTNAHGAPLFAAFTNFSNHPSKNSLVKQANVVPVVASNRVGREEFSGSHITFYGSSFVADQTGNIVAECSYRPECDPEGVEGASAESSSKAAVVFEGGDSKGEIAIHTFDLESIRLQRAGWGLFRDRRPSLYQPLLTLDGRAAALPK